MTSSTINHVISRPSISGTFRKGRVEHTMGATHTFGTWRTTRRHRVRPNKAVSPASWSHALHRRRTQSPVVGFAPPLLAVFCHRLLGAGPHGPSAGPPSWAGPPANRRLACCARGALLPKHVRVPADTLVHDECKPLPAPPPSALAPCTLLWVVLRLLLARRCSKTITVTLDVFESGDFAWKKFCCLACASIGDSLSFVKRMKRHGLVCECVGVHFVCCVFRCEWGGGRAGEAPRVVDSRPARQVGTLNIPPPLHTNSMPPSALCCLPFSLFYGQLRELRQSSEYISIFELVSVARRCDCSHALWASHVRCCETGLRLVGAHRECWQDHVALQGCCFPPGSP